MNSTEGNFNLALSEVERTFDGWLAGTAKKAEKVMMHFGAPPLNDEVYSHDVLVLEVDKDFVLVEFFNGEVFWIQKELISSAGLSEV
jgi:hypothetical protein